MSNQNAGPDRNPGRNPGSEQGQRPTPDPAPAPPRAPAPDTPDPTGRFNPDFLTELFRHPLDPSYAAAAESRKQHPLPPARRRIRRTVALVALVIIGMLFATAYRHVVTTEPQREKAREGMIKQINQRSEVIADLRARSEALQGDVEELREAALSKTALRQLRELEAATGIREVTGDGVTVRLSHAQNARLGDDGFIVDYDLQVIANQLWELGAEAIAINGQRLTTTSAIRHTSAGMHVGNVPIPSPYEIVAIGPDELAQRFEETKIAEYYRRHLQERYRIGFSINSATEVTLPAIKLRELHFAAPLTDSSRESGGSSGGNK